jgi:DNA-binding winged helix-turn-helix (wHTH) protein
MKRTWHSGELRKDGTRVRLQGQPFQLLVMLLERPGELVTREEVCQKLWSTGTFVDFDHSLGTAINKIREVLNDSAGEPRYVEILPRRGYRFVAQVISVDPEPVPESREPASPEPATAEPAPLESAERLASSPKARLFYPTPSGRRHSRRQTRPSLADRKLRVKNLTPPISRCQELRSADLRPPC